MIHKFVAVSVAALLLTTPALAQESFIFVSGWNGSVQLTAEQSDKAPSADVASPGWVSADWITEPAPAYGPGAFYLRNGWRNTYLTYIHEWRPQDGVQNAVLRPKITNPTTPQDRVLADGQAWVFEPVQSPGGVPGAGRLRPAHKGFGLTYLTISSTLGTPEWKPGQGTTFHQPEVSNRTAAHPGTLWVRTKSSKADQQQCVKNMSATVIDVDWFQGRDVKLQMAGPNVLALVPPKDKAPAIHETKSLFFESCETSNQRMVAVVSLYGKRTVEGAIGVTASYLGMTAGVVLVPVVGGVGGFAAGSMLGAYLQKKPNTVYVGTPGKITVKGNLFDASAEANEAVKY